MKLRADRLGGVGRRRAAERDPARDRARHRERAAPRGDDRRLDSDGVHGRPRGGARQRRAGTRVRGALMRFAKETGTAVMVVGHVTKGGGIAGPKTLEHIVDAVLYFEGDSALDHRVLRATKNRFGSVDEIGVFR